MSSHISSPFGGSNSRNLKAPSRARLVVNETRSPSRGPGYAVGGMPAAPRFDDVPGERGAASTPPTASNRVRVRSLATVLR
jgi:hypothetical protein